MVVFRIFPIVFTSRNTFDVGAVVLEEETVCIADGLSCKSTVLFDFVVCCDLLFSCCASLLRIFGCGDCLRGIQQRFCQICYPGDEIVYPMEFKANHPGPNSLSIVSPLIVN